MTQGAVRPSQHKRRQEREVFAIARRALWRRGVRLWGIGHGRASMLILASVGLGPGLVDENKPPRIDPRATRLPPFTPPLATSGRSCSEARTRTNVTPSCWRKCQSAWVTDHQAAVGQLLSKRAASGQASRRSAPEFVARSRAPQGRACGRPSSAPPHCRARWRATTLLAFARR